MDKKSPKQLIVEKIKNSNNILLVSHVNPDGDALGSTLALYHTLKKIGKQTSIAMAGQRSEHLSFLPGFADVKTELSGAREFIITLTTDNTQPPHKVKYQTEANKIHLIITPGNGNFRQEDVTVKEGKHQFDLIIVTDTPNLERLDSIYDGQTEIFYETPIINLDHHGDNDGFGEINFVDTNSSSVAEIVVSIIEALSVEQNLLDNQIATCILTGILSDTSSFQNNNTTPKCLTVAAQMIAAGADHQTIIKNLFKSQPLSQLKVWGKILTKLQIKPSLKLAWSTLSLAELQESGATPDETSGVIDALIRNLPDINIFMLLVQTDELIKGSFRSLPPVNINPIATELGGGGHPQASGFRLFDMTLVDAEQLTLATIEKHLTGNTTTPPSISEPSPPQPTNLTPNSIPTNNENNSTDLPPTTPLN